MTFSDLKKVAESATGAGQVAGTAVQQTQQLFQFSAEQESMKLGIPGMLQDAMSEYETQDKLTASRV
eukprot:CAMPEP_0184289894 /NCGR_PEP_ID=MMETSP1049-20130417/2264_1 /TAXON_ID=77928 /ORGANISM="Proteomonas sulcata, Strain CCMP704" /LENGTH=66 /DNA_ID=CAMNT_0026596875 /DNA_START=116 /DNA_END=316 /DNA_ORIENTATION=+